ncbi:MAG: hypothetical protein M3454_05870 [Actinomycetota bacterium]|nr:hypothetical protein [Actinomycetota bacterium]
MPEVGPHWVSDLSIARLGKRSFDTEAERNRAQVRIGALLSRQGIEVDNVDPLEVLLYQLGWASGAARALGRLVSELEEIHGPNHAGAAVPHILVRMWSEERDRAARLAKMAIDAGLAEKQVLLALEAFSKKTRTTPAPNIRLAERRLADWRRRGSKR